MTLESLLMIIIWVFTLTTLLGLLSALIFPGCGERGRGRHCNVHNGNGVWK